MLYHDYEILIVQDYEKKKARNVLHSGLTDPTPAGIRDACMAVFHERYEKRDEKTLKEFFKPRGETSAWPQIIEGHPAGMFKALAKFLNKETERTKNTNMELLAWLINFQPRPFVIGNTIKVDIANNVQEETEKNKGEDSANQIREEIDKAAAGLPGREPRPVRTKVGLIIGLVTILALAGIGVYWPITSKPPKYTSTGHEGCMFWDEDHYQPISCRQHGDTMVIALDSSKLIHFRKVMKPDTITTNAIGSLWYTKYRKNYEYYTSDGYHPNDPTLRLRPVTEYIIRNHVHPEQ